MHTPFALDLWQFKNCTKLIVLRLDFARVFSVLPQINALSAQNIASDGVPESYESPAQGWSEWRLKEKFTIFRYFWERIVYVLLQSENKYSDVA